MEPCNFIENETLLTFFKSFDYADLFGNFMKHIWWLLSIQARI